MNEISGAAIASDVLARICSDKWAHIKRCKAWASEADLAARAKSVSAPRGFAAALRRARDQGGYGLIAEIKKASPSRGLIRADFAPKKLARAYQAGGATCLSVLTDEPYFQGRDAYLKEARDAADMPVLRKDFMLDPYQVIESRALGADCILLIMAALDDAQASELERAAFEHGMDVLVEVHNRPELDRALDLKSPLVGINNRNLKTLEVDLKTTEDLAGVVGEDRILVSESGLYERADLDRMAKVGARCFLIGESLMRQPDVERATKALFKPVAVANSA